MLNGRGRGAIFAGTTILTAAAAVVALAVPGAAGATPKTTIQLGQRVCAAARPGHMSCLAMRLVTKQVSAEQAKNLEAAGVARPATAHPDVSFGPAGGYSPGQLATAYGVNPGASTSQTVAIVDAFNDPTVLGDLNHFDSQYGLPQETTSSFKVVNQTGGSSLPANNAGWAGEITLDVQTVRGLCHKCKILLVEAKNSSSANLGAAVNYAAAHAKIVSNSYGGPETDPEDTNAVKADYNHPGVAILASTGDDGWYDWDNFNAGGSSDNVPSTPASYNTVVGVGGTTLNVNPNSTRASESVWNDNGPYDDYGLPMSSAMGASGSGCSTIYNAQQWQQKVAGYGTLGCGSTKRNGVDIAAEADYFTGIDIFESYGHPTPVCSGPCWYTIGGTSLASPLIAALWGLAGGPAGVKYPALTLYGHYKSDRSHLYDVTVGGTGLCDLYSPVACWLNTNPNTLGGGLLDCAWGASGSAVKPNHAQCYAQPGYDGVSGVGTPKGTNPFKPLSPTAVISAPSSITHGQSASFSGSKSSSPFPGGSITSYTWNWGDGHSSSGQTVSHTYAAKGTYNVTLTVADTYTSQNNGRVGHKTITVTVN